MVGLLGIMLAMVWHQYRYFKSETECLLTLQQDYRQYIELLNDQYSTMQEVLNKKKSPIGSFLPPTEQ